MTDRVKLFFNTQRYQGLIDNEYWGTLLNVMHDEAMLENSSCTEIINVLEDGLGVDLRKEQEYALVTKLKALLAAGYPINSLYKNVYGGIRIRSWLLSREWTNLYGLSLDDAINTLIEANYNIEETPDMGTLLWI